MRSSEIEHCKKGLSVSLSRRDRKREYEGSLLYFGLIYFYRID